MAAYWIGSAVTINAKLRPIRYNKLSKTFKSTMTEADLFEQLMTVSELVLLSISVSFTVISAYIVGLYWFLENSRVFLKTMAFMIFSLTLLPLVIMAIGLYRHHEGATIALIELNKTSPLSPLGRMAIEDFSVGIGDSVSIGLTIVALLIYIGMFYLTFFHEWKKR